MLFNDGGKGNMSKFETHILTDLKQEEKSLKRPHLQMSASKPGAMIYPIDRLDA